MSPKNLADNIEGLIISANETFARMVILVQNKLYNDLVLILKGVEVDADGYVLQSAANRKILNEAIFKIDESFAENTPYVNSLDEYLKTIPKIDALNAAYFETIKSGFVPNKNFIRSLQKQSIESIERGILNEGLESQIKGPLVDILNQNINTGGSFVGMVKQVQDYVIGNEKIEGHLLHYTKTYVRDALFSYSRSYQQAFTSDLGLVWYLFSGPVIPAGKGSEGSRGWCLEKKGLYFHETEIKAWASEDWAGKKPGTTTSSMFINLGGWNCIDSLIPVHESVVPTSDLDRMK